MTDVFPRSVTIYGTGLMGSSFGLALKARIPQVRVYGVDSPDVLQRSRRVGAIDEGEAQVPDLSDLIILAAPVSAILGLLDSFSPNSSLILDIGSTKVDICGRAVSRGLPFVGGHPMTGSERSGPEAAKADLFEGRPFFLCPVSSTPTDAIPKVTRVAEAIGAKPVLTTAEEHDRVVARLSHLPQILSTLLADQTSELRPLAGTGLESVTRLAKSPFHVWKDIFETSGSLPGELRLFADRLRSVVEALEQGNMKEIETIFARANLSVPE
jgi:prephenate dehydrogenase